jgi:membrane dipeptidase
VEKTSMNGLIITPDENFIAEFQKAEAEKRSGPAFPLVDAHVDLPYFLDRNAPGVAFGDLQTGPFTLETARQAGVRLFCTALYCEDRFNGQGALRHFEGLFDRALKGIEPAPVIESETDLDAVLDDPEAMGTLLLLENADLLAEDPAYAEELKFKGIRIVGLTHAGRNRLADGNGVAYPDGLTPQGRKAVRALADTGLIIDVAHLHPTCFWQLMRIHEGPVITSHTGIRRLFDTPRNVDLEQVREILDRGGMVGITFNPEMLSPGGNAGLEDVVVHLDTVVQKFGPAAVGIGSDFCGFDTPAEGLEDVSRIDGLARELLARGYERDAVAAIMGQNWIDLFRRVFTA